VVLGVLTISLQLLSNPHGRPRIFWLPTYASRNLLFWLAFVILIFLFLGVCLLLDLCASSTAAWWLWVGSRIRGGVFLRF
jgi:uncharacterized membrane protein